MLSFLLKTTTLGVANMARILKRGIVIRMLQEGLRVYSYLEMKGFLLVKCELEPELKGLGGAKRG